MIIYNGVNLESVYSCNIFRSETDTSPAREVESVAIAGRSGNLVIDGKRYPNVDMEYTAVFHGENADANAVELKNFLLSQIGYKELRDNEHPDEFYLAIVSKDIAPVLTEDRNKVKMRLTFNRKPQRYLMSGKTEYSLMGGTLNGNPIYTDLYNIDMESLTISASVENWFSTRAPSSNVGFAGIEGVIISMDGRQITAIFPFNTYTRTHINPDWEYNAAQYAVEFTAEVGSGGSGLEHWTKWRDDTPPSQFWEKLAGYDSVYTVPFALNNSTTPVLCSFMPFSDEANYDTECLFYDSTNQSLVCVADPYINTLDKFVDWYDSQKSHYIICEGTRTRSFYLNETIPYGHLLSAEVVLNGPYRNNTATFSVDTTPTDKLENPTYYAAKPIIRIYGNGGLQIGNPSGLLEYITVSNSTDYVDIDCDMMDCYEGTTNRNNDVVFSTYDFPVLEPGETEYTILSDSNVTDVRIIPRWWRL